MPVLLAKASGKTAKRDTEQHPPQYCLICAKRIGVFGLIKSRLGSPEVLSILSNSHPFSKPPNSFEMASDPLSLPSLF